MRAGRAVLLQDEPSQERPLLRLWPPPVLGRRLRFVLADARDERLGGLTVGLGIVRQPVTAGDQCVERARAVVFELRRRGHVGRFP